MTIRATALLTLSLALAAAGCGRKAPLVGPNYAKAMGEMKDDAALLYVYRFAAEPTDATATILLDGKEVAQLENRAFTWLHAAPGAHRVAVRWPAVSGQHPADVAVELRKSEPNFVELTGVHGTTGHGVMIASTLEQQPRDLAEKRIAKCGYQKALAPAPAQ
jgi:predicted small lipoprotein YifL